MYIDMPHFAFEQPLKCKWIPSKCIQISRPDIQGVAETAYISISAVSSKCMQVLLRWSPVYHVLLQIKCAVTTDIFWKHRIIDYWILVDYSCVHQVIGCRLRLYRHFAFIVPPCSTATFQGHQLFAAAPLRCHDEHRGLGPLSQRCVLCPSGVGAARRASKYHSEAWRFVRWIEGGAWCLRTSGRDGYWVESEWTWDS